MITKDLLKALRPEIEAALAAVAQKHGIVIRAGNCSFTPESATFKLELATIGTNGNVVTKEATAFKINAGFYGLTPDHLGKKFVSGGSEFTLVGYNSRAHKMPFVVKDERGRGFKMSEAAIKRGFGV